MKELIAAVEFRRDLGDRLAFSSDLGGPTGGDYHLIIRDFKGCPPTVRLFLTGSIVKRIAA